MSYQLQEINRRIDQDVKGFLEACDAQYANKVSQAADTILNNLSTSPIVLLSGPSGSGKTTTALKIEEELEKRGVLSHTISMDNYFKTLNPKTVPRQRTAPLISSPLCAWTWTCSMTTLPSPDRLLCGNLIGMILWVVKQLREVQKGEQDDS